MKDTNLLIQNGIDISKGIELLGDIDTYNEMLESFLEEVSEKLSNIDQYKKAGDMPNYAILVHSLKSDSKYLGFTTLADIAYQHEIESKNNNASFIIEHYEELLKEANRIIKLVKQYLGN